MDEHEKSLDLNDESGMTRRDLLRRGAIVGGTLLWVAPAIQSLGTKAFAVEGNRGSKGCAACYCWSPHNPGNPQGTHGNPEGGEAGTNVTQDGLRSKADCHDWCTHTGAYASSGGIFGGPLENSDYCTGTAHCDALTSSTLTGITNHRASCS
jgi:hypothetical protein